MTTLFLDANVLFTAACSPEGRSAALLRLAEAGLCRAVTSPHAATEARRNLALERPEALPRLEDALRATIATVPEPGPRAVAAARAHGQPPHDAPILAAAVASGADLLVTGDRRHFGHLLGRTVAGVLVATPRAALAHILAGPGGG